MYSLKEFKGYLGEGLFFKKIEVITIDVFIDVD